MTYLLRIVGMVGSSLKLNNLKKVEGNLIGEKKKYYMDILNCKQIQGYRHKDCLLIPACVT